MEVERNEKGRQADNRGEKREGGQGNERPSPAGQREILTGKGPVLQG